MLPRALSVIRSLTCVNWSTHPAPETYPAAGSRVLGLFRCIQVTVLMLRHNPHPRVTGRHPHGLPIHHLEGDYGLHSLDRRGPPSLGARRGRSSTQIRQYIIDGTLGALLVMARAPRAVLRQTPHDRSEPAGGLHPGRTARLDPENHQQAVCMMQRPSRNPDSSRHLMPRRILGTRATSDWE